MRIRTLAMVTLALAIGPRVEAQEMGQGHAHITTRSDVRLSMESVPGTSAVRLSALGRSIGAGMSAMRTCYGEVIAARPTVVGTMRLRVSLGERGAPEIEILEDGPNDRELSTCIRGVIARQDVSEVGRPAAAIVVLEMQNTAARGAAETAARAETAAEIPIAREEGRPLARGEAPGVRFLVRGAADTADALVAEGMRVVRSQIAGMLDCRRRAGRRGMDPSGTIDLRMRMAQGRAPAMDVVATTVRDERAPVCLERALERPQHRPESGPATLEVRVEFLAGP